MIKKYCTQFGSKIYMVNLGLCSIEIVKNPNRMPVIVNCISHIDRIKRAVLRMRK